MLVYIKCRPYNTLSYCMINESTKRASRFGGGRCGRLLRCGWWCRGFSSTCGGRRTGAVGFSAAVDSTLRAFAARAEAVAAGTLPDCQLWTLICKSHQCMWCHARLLRYSQHWPYFPAQQGDKNENDALDDATTEELSHKNMSSVSIARR